MAKRQVTVVAHTHWDREWYEPFESYRFRLVALLDDLIAYLDANDDYTSFMLDGQMAVIDDYLEIRPNAEPTLRRLIAEGRIGIGPWYVLADEFLVSGETILRNLEYGLQRATDFGSPLKVGYLPDMFGHIAQMPQIFQIAGFTDAVVFRGVPRAVTRTSFRWTGLDGSVVRAEYLPAGYDNGEYSPDAPTLLAAVKAFDIGGDVRNFGSVLWMHGTDHKVPDKNLPATVLEANATQDEFNFVIGTLTDHLALQPDSDDPALSDWTGEMRSSARANLLTNTMSNRVDVRLAVAHAERDLERYAEPLRALTNHIIGTDHLQVFLDRAWKLLIQNSAHDSICACSNDATVRAVLNRYDDAIRLSHAVTDSCLALLERQIAPTYPTFFNPGCIKRSAIISCVVPIDNVPHTVQRLVEVDPLAEAQTTILELELNSDELRGLLQGIRKPALTPDAHICGMSIVENDNLFAITLQTTRDPEQAFDLEPQKAKLRRLLTDHPSKRFHLRVVQAAVTPVLAWLPDVAAYGFGALTFDTCPDHPISAVCDTDTELHVTNGLVSLVVNRATGLWKLDGMDRFVELVDVGDAGDTYNYCAPANDVEVRKSTHPSILVAESGPLRTSIHIVATYNFPAKLSDDTTVRIGVEPTVVTTVLSIEADNPVVNVGVSFVNRSESHRLSIHVPLVHPASTSLAETAFGVVERGLSVEHGAESPPATFPSRRFVHAGGVTVLHRGTPEYELVDIDGRASQTLSLTLIRATGWLSRVVMANRPSKAGPPIATPEAQMLGPVHIELGIALTSNAIAPMYELAERFTTNVLRLAKERINEEGLDFALFVDPGANDNTSHSPEVPAPLLNVSGAVVSSIRMVDKALEVRVFNPTRATTKFEASMPTSTADTAVDLGPGKIHTVRL